MNKRRRFEIRRLNNGRRIEQTPAGDGHNHLAA